MINYAKLLLNVTRMMHENEPDRRVKLDIPETMISDEMRIHFICFQTDLH